jgi:hypothetical protein
VCGSNDTKYSDMIGQSSKCVDGGGSSAGEPLYFRNGGVVPPVARAMTAYVVGLCTLNQVDT